MDHIPTIRPYRPLALAWLLAAVLVACAPGHGGPPTPPDVAAERAVVDRPDEASGRQVHFLYVLPADGADRRLDIDGTLARSVASMQGWLAAQTGGRRLRLDTYRGAPDVTFARLRRTDAEMRAFGVHVRDSVEAELRRAGLVAPEKSYGVYYDGGNTAACGGAAWPPVLPGQVSALYLRGTPPGATPCDANRFAPAADAPPGYVEFAMLHELLHTLGFVGRDAPRHALSGHVGDDPRDLMYAGPEPWRPAVLDVGRDDYYGDRVPAGVPNFAESPFLAPAPAAAVTRASRPAR